MSLSEKDGFYLDTSIWLDIYEKRGENGEFALEFIRRVLDRNIRVYYSDLVLVELKILGYDEEIVDMMSVIPYDSRRKAHIFEVQKTESKRISISRSVPKGDALHAILARDNNLIMITRDAHFQRLKDIVSAKKPEELI